MEIRRLDGREHSSDNRAVRFAKLQWFAKSMKPRPESFVQENLNHGVLLEESVVEVLLNDHSASRLDGMQVAT